MTDIWKRLDAFLQENLPETYADLRHGASATMIADVEQILTMRLPDGYRSWVAHHDGQNGKAVGVIGNWQLLPLGEVAREWKLWREVHNMGTFRDWQAEPARGIREGWWNPAWIPITFDGQGNHHCIDLDPDVANGGKMGQIILVWHDEPRRERIAESFEEWIRTSIIRLESGNLTLITDEIGIRFAQEGFLPEQRFRFRV